jgi:hypothetical protein
MLMAKESIAKIYNLADETLDKAETLGFTIEETELIPEVIESQLKTERWQSKKLYTRKNPTAEAMGDASIDTICEGIGRKIKETISSL